MSETIQSVQQREHQWRIANKINETPAKLFHRLQGEMSELFETVFHDGKDKLDVASELADIAIFSIALMSHFGIDAEKAINGKLRRNEDKYSPEVRAYLMEQGMTVEEAEAYQKLSWDKHGIVTGKH